jgi:hypothetical protein
MSLSGTASRNARMMCGGVIASTKASRSTGSVGGSRPAIPNAVNIQVSFS